MMVVMIVVVGLAVEIRYRTQRKENEPAQV